MRNTQAFRDALDCAMQHLSDRGVMVRQDAVADVVEANMTAVAERLGIQPRSAWHHFDAAAVADSLCRAERSGALGEPPWPSLDNPELALILGSVPDAVMDSRGDLYQVIMTVALNAWAAGHIHGEDGCPGCTHRGAFESHDWAKRMAAHRAEAPDFADHLDEASWNAALRRTGYRLRLG